MEDVKQVTLEKVEEILGGKLTQQEIKDIIYSAYSYSTAINEHNLNDVFTLLTKIDWVHFINKKA